MFNPMCLICFSPCAYDSSEMKSLPVVIRERDVEYQVCDCPMKYHFNLSNPDSLVFGTIPQKNVCVCEKYLVVG